MGLFRLVAVALATAALAFPAAAEDTALLIQIQPDGRYQVWHAGGLRFTPRPTARNSA